MLNKNLARPILFCLATGDLLSKQQVSAAITIKKIKLSYQLRLSYHNMPLVDAISLIDVPVCAIVSQCCGVIGYYLETM